MVSPDPLSDLFMALANPARRAILSRLAAEALTPHELATTLDLSPREAAAEIGRLEAAGLVVIETRAGRDALRLRTDGIVLLENWLSWFHRFRIDSHDRLQSCIVLDTAPLHLGTEAD